MPGILRTKTKDGKWRAWHKSHLTGSDGRRKTLKFTGTHSRRETLPLAHERQVQEDRIAAGLIPAPEDREPWRDFVDTVQDYLAYGESQGGRGGRPWGRTHARNQRARLAWWHEQIGFKTLEDLTNPLRPVETALVRLRDRGRTSKTLRNYQGSLQSFCRWCIDRGYLPSDPPARLRKFDGTPRTRRRVLTLADIAAILAVALPERRLLYEMALFSGLRRGELRHLRGAPRPRPRRCAAGSRVDEKPPRRIPTPAGPPRCQAGAGDGVPFQPADARAVATAVDARLR